MSVSVDLSEMSTLMAVFEAAIETTTKERRRILRDVGAEVEEEARSRAAVRRDTGELEAAIRRRMVGGTRVRIGADVRQAFFLEYGSPNTGAPYPWLSEPAERGAERILDELGKAGGLW